GGERVAVNLVVVPHRPRRGYRLLPYTTLFRSLGRRHRGVVHRGDGQGDRDRAARQAAVAGLVGERVGAVEVHPRGVGEAAVRVEREAAVGRGAHKERGERVAVDVGIVYQQPGG